MGINAVNSGSCMSIMTIFSSSYLPSHYSQLSRVSSKSFELSELGNSFQKALCAADGINLFKFLHIASFFPVFMPLGARLGSGIVLGAFFSQKAKLFEISVLIIQ